MAVSLAHTMQRRSAVFGSTVVATMSWRQTKGTKKSQYVQQLHRSRQDSLRFLSKQSARDVGYDAIGYRNVLPHAMHAVASRPITIAANRNSERDHQLRSGLVISCDGRLNERTNDGGKRNRD